MMNTRRRYTVNDVVNNAFYQVPKFLFSGEFENLGNDARMLYGILKDRHELSLKNRWMTKDGEVYLIYTRKDMMAMLGVCEKTVTKAMQALVKHGLLEEVRRGQGQANLIFIYMVVVNQKETDMADKGSKNPLNSDKSLNRKMCGSRTEKNAVLEPKNLRANNTDINKTDNNKTNLSINQRNELISSGDGLMEFKSYEAVVQENINFKDLLIKFEFREDEIEEIVKLIVELLMLDDGQTLKINQKNIPACMVKQRMMELNFEHIQYVMHCLDTISHEIKNIHAYLITTLYNAPATMGNYYGAKARQLNN